MNGEDLSQEGQSQHLIERADEYFAWAKEDSKVSLHVLQKSHAQAIAITTWLYRDVSDRLRVQESSFPIEESSLSIVATAGWHSALALR